MHTYTFIIERDDGEQRRVKASWEKSAALVFQESHGLSLEKEVEKFIGYEIQKEIKKWEREDMPSEEDKKKATRKFQTLAGTVLKVFNKLIRWLGFKNCLSAEIIYTSPEEARKLFGMDREEELINYLGEEIKKELK